MGSSRLACARNGYWCLVTIPERGEVCKASFVDGRVSLVANGLSDGQGLALIRQDKEVLVSGRSGLVQVFLEDGSRRVLLDSWPRDGRPDSLAVDERGSGVFGREEGLAIVYAADSDSSSVFSVDLSSENDVVDSRLAFETSLPLDITFDAARGEVLVAGYDGLSSSNSRVLGAAIPMPRILDGGRHFVALEWLGPAHGAILDRLGRVDRIEEMRKLAETYSGRVAFSDPEGIYLLTVPSQHDEDFSPEKISNLSDIQDLASAGESCNFVALSLNGTLTCFSIRSDDGPFFTQSIQVPSDGCEDEMQKGGTPTPLWPLYSTQLVWETDAPASQPTVSPVAAAERIPLPTTTTVRGRNSSTNATSSAVGSEDVREAALPADRQQSGLVTGLSVLGLVALISFFVRRLRQRRGARATAYAVLSQDDAWETQEDRRRRRRRRQGKQKEKGAYEEVSNRDDDDDEDEAERTRRSESLKKKKKKVGVGYSYEFVDVNDDSELEDTDEGVFV